MSTDPSETTLHSPGEFRRFAIELSRAATPGEVLDVVTRHGRAMFGATRAGVAIRSSREGWLDLVAVDRLDEADRLKWSTFPSSTAVPMAAAFRTGTLQVHGDLVSLYRDFPTFRSWSETNPTQANLAAPLHVGDQVVGAVSFSFDRPQQFGAAEIQLLEAIASLSAVVLERARLFAESVQDAEHQRFLARASEVMGTSLDLEETLQTVAGLAVPSFADWVVVDLFDTGLGNDDGSFRRVVIHHGSPERVAHARAYHAKYPPLPDQIERFRHEGPQRVADITDEMLVRAARSPEHLADTRALGLKSWMAVPILGRGQVYGLFTFIHADSDRRYTAQDLAVATDLARRAGVAFENALLYEGVRTAEREVAQAQRMFARIADATPDILFVTELPSGRNIYVNRDLAKVLGYSADELRTVRVSVLRTYVHPDDMERVVADLGRVPDLEDGGVIEHGYRLRHADGSWRFVDVRSVVFARGSDGRPSQLLSVGRDVTPERMQALALARSEERYRLATDAVGGVVYEVEVGTDRVTRSPGLLGLLGFEPTEDTATATWWWSRMHPDDVERKTRALEDALGAGRNLMELEYRVLHRDDTWRWVWDRARLEVNARGELVRMVGCATDVTDRVHATRAMEEADRRKDEFLALVGHELRNPLAAVRNAVDVLARTGPADQAFERARGVVVRQIGHMGRMLEDLLDLSRMTKDRLLLRAEPLDLVALLRRTVEEHRSELEHLGITLSLEGMDQPLFVSGDDTRLEQVFANLLDNAGKFSDPGGRIGVRMSSDPSEVEVAIVDTGVGIDAEQLDRLFEPFVQGERRLESSNGGLGLGLALVEGLVALHGGRVRAISRGAGHGATFVVTLPRVERPAVTGGTDGVGSAEPDGRRILIVEDNEDAGAMLKMLLEFGGHTVELAGDGSAGVALARTFVPEVVLCDIGLPGALDGYGVARALRAAETDGRAFLVALTGYGQLEDQQRAMDAGFDRHVTKPIDPAELEALILLGS